MREMIRRFATWLQTIFKEKPGPAQSSYVESAQTVVVCRAALQKRSWSSDAALPVVSGETTTPGFRPTVAICTETLRATFKNKIGTAVRCAVVTDCSDLVLVRAEHDSESCLRDLNLEYAGLSCQAFSSLWAGAGISWPRLPEGTRLSLRVAVCETVLSRVDPPLGFTLDDVVEVDVTAQFTFIGPKES